MFPVQILSQAQELDSGSVLTGHFFLDPDLGLSTTVLLAYDVTEPEVNVTSPSGRVYSRVYPEYSLDSGLHMVKFLIPGMAEVMTVIRMHQTVI